MNRTYMKATRRLAAALIAAAVSAAAAHAAAPAAQQTDSTAVRRSGDFLAVDFELDLTGVRPTGDMASVITPRLISADSADSLDLPAVGVYSRSRYFHYLRAGGDMPGGPDETVIRASENPGTMPYSAVVSFLPWMADSRLILSRTDYTCCDKAVYGPGVTLAVFKDRSPEAYFPELLYLTPEAEAVKTRHLSGRAFIDFPVSRTDILPDYRANARELAAIRATIDSVRNDPDINVSSISITGFASPESPYSNNERLAKGRTIALAKHVSALYSFPDGFISTSWVPEDWDGLRAFISSSALKSRDAMLDLIDNSGLEPDELEARIKARYPEDYRFLLDHCYPALRHSDYTIEYVVRSFSDPQKIREMARTAPQKLSLSEFHLAARELEPGSEEFNELFETAVRMYPDDPAANLNAANVALSAGDLHRAETLLARAGDSPQASYARGVLAFLSGDYELAKEHLSQALEAGISQAGELMEHIGNNI